MTDRDKQSVPAPVFDVGGEDSTDCDESLNLVAGGSTECIDKLVEQRDTALAHLRATAGLLLYTKREFRPEPPFPPYNFVVVTRCKGGESSCGYEHQRVADGRERLVEGHSADCPIGFLDRLHLEKDAPSEP